MDGAHVVLRGKWPTVMGRLRGESFGKTFSVGRVGVTIKAAGNKTRVAGRPGAVCIRKLLVLLREVDFVERGTGLGVTFSGLVLVNKWDAIIDTIISHTFRMEAF